MHEISVAIQAGNGGILELLFSPFLEMARFLIGLIVDVLGNTPTIHPNPAVQTIHRLTLVVAYVSSGLVVAAAGIHYILGINVGFSYQRVRLILPRLIIALIFSAISLSLLQFGVEASDAFVEAFLPQDIDLEQLAGLSTSLVLVWFVNAWLLLALAILFVLRQVYLLFGAAISPILALAWTLPESEPYANVFISGWFVALVIAPLDILVLRFNLALLDASGALGLQPASNWVLGVASFVLMLWVPYQLYGVSQAMIGSSRRIAGDVARSGGGGSDGSDDDGDEERRDRRNRRDRRRRRR